MYHNKTILGLIPARAGSKGIRNKNIKPLLGKPLIAYTIETALKSRVFDRVIVSTDSLKIKNISQDFGAEVPFLRPKYLAKDNTPMIFTVKHALKFLKQRENFIPDVVVLLQPTSPLRKPIHIKKALEKFFNSKADSVVSLCEIIYSPYWMKRLIKEKVTPFLGEERYARRQDLPKVYRENGAVYISKRDIIMRRNSILGKNTKAIIMDKEESIDIDTELDFQLAELTLRQRLCRR